MEEKILKILLSHIEAVTEKNSPFVATAINGVPQSAKEIASHFREFIEWIGFSIKSTKYSGNLFYREISNTWFYSKTFIIEPKEYTLDELYNYWIKEVRK